MWMEMALLVMILSGRMRNKLPQTAIEAESGPGTNVPE